jgi:hypothetical protein
MLNGIFRRYTTINNSSYFIRIPVLIIRTVSSAPTLLNITMKAHENLRALSATFL